MNAVELLKTKIEIWLYTIHTYQRLVLTYVHASLSCLQAVQDKRQLIVSQLSLVDLAGSERASRTSNNGERLREANHINTALMVLRKCMETLRDNQLSAAGKVNCGGCMLGRGWSIVGVMMCGGIHVRTYIRMYTLTYMHDSSKRRSERKTGGKWTRASNLHIYVRVYG